MIMDVEIKKGTRASQRRRFYRFVLGYMYADNVKESLSSYVSLCTRKRVLEKGIM